MKQRKGFKIVINYFESGQRQSCCSDGEITSYQLNRTTRPHPNCGPLAVFVSIKKAKEFLKKHFPGTVWCFGWARHIHRCNYRPSKHTSLWSVKGRGCIASEALPRGTALADSVTLKERVA